MFNEIDGDFEDVVVRTFKVGLPPEHELRKSLSRKPARSMRLMDQIDEYKRVKEDQQQGKGKVKVTLPDQSDFRTERYNSNRSMRDFSGPGGHSITQAINTVFREPVL